ncbi:MAG: hypothetical protein P4L62_03110 [Candidatus Pacebacteria bacterium]|nr:hypothetical protein [Candidatus Paceibacterota bacterium]MDR3583322.1 hypothetical protein [Candidatus Paceibacterota bacterium]
MRKRSILFVVFAAVMIFLPVNFALAGGGGGCQGGDCGNKGGNGGNGGTNVDINNQQQQSQSQSLYNKFSPNNEINIPMQAPGIGGNDLSGGSINTGAFLNAGMTEQDFIRFYPELSCAGWNNLAYSYTSENGDDYWRKIESAIRVDADFKNRYTPTASLRTMITLPKGVGYTFVGTATGKVDPKSGIEVSSAAVYYRTGIAGMHAGANVMMPYEAYTKAVQQASGHTFGLSLGIGFQMVGIGIGTSKSSKTLHVDAEPQGTWVFLYVSPGAIARALTQVAPQSTEQIARCVLPGPRNVNLRIDDAMLDIRNYNQRHDLRDLRLTRDTLLLAIKLDRASGQQLRTVYEMLASVNLELARVINGFDREHYQKLAVKYAYRAGLSSIRTINEY